MATAPCTTEIALLQLTPGADPRDTSNPASIILQDAMKTISSQDGYQRMAWGIAAEAQNMVVLAIDWDSLEAHKKFISQPYYAPFIQNLGKILEGPPALFHVDLSNESRPETNHLTKCSATVTQVLITYYAEDKATPELQKQVVNDRGEFIKIITGEPSVKMRRASRGWAIEDSIEVDGQKVKPHIILFGWDSIEDHREVGNMQITQDNKQLLFDGKDASKVVYHAELTLV